VARIAGSCFHRRWWHSPLPHTQAGGIKLPWICSLA
jgi:hypothetical protein